MKTLLLALLMTFSFTTMASAHVQLISSSPADGAVLAESPKEILLEMSTDMRMTKVELVNADGDKIKTGDLPKSFNAKVSFTIPTLEAGSYTLSWYGTAKDMHPRSGKIKFSVK